LVLCRGQETEAREALQDTLCRVARHVRRFDDHDQQFEALLIECVGELDPADRSLVEGKYFSRLLVIAALISWMRRTTSCWRYFQAGRWP